MHLLDVRSKFDAFISLPQDVQMKDVFYLLTMNGFTVPINLLFSLNLVGLFLDFDLLRLILIVKEHK